MGINVELRTSTPAPRHGRVSTSVLDTVVDFDNVFVDLLNRAHKSGRTPTLDTIDPYANVTLSGAQVRNFIDELPLLRAYATSDAERGMLTAIAALAHRCVTEANCHLHFVGD